MVIVAMGQGRPPRFSGPIGMRGNMKRKSQKIVDETPARGRLVGVYPPAQKFERQIVDELAWVLLIDPDCRDKPGWPETLARHLYEIKEAIESGPEGVGLVFKALDEGIRVAYQYTPIHRAALRLFYLHVAGELPGDGPQELLDEVIDDAIKRPGARQIDLPKHLT
jgi:hypothetical protein